MEQIKKKLDINGDLIIEGYASIFDNTDSDDEIVIKNAFELPNANIPMLIDHQPSAVVGRWEEFKQDGIGLKAVGRIFAEFPQVQERIQKGTVRGLSWGGRVLKALEVETKRMLQHIKLDEISITGFPANVQAVITTKSTPDFQDYDVADIPWESDGALSRWRKYTKSTEEPTNDYKNATFWRDVVNPDLFGSYKLHFVDIIDGEPKAIKSAISMALETVQGEDVGIPAVDKEVVLAHINKYLDKTKIMEEQDVSNNEKNIEIVESFKNFIEQKEQEKLRINDYRGMHPREREKRLISMNISNKLAKKLANVQLDDELDSVEQEYKALNEIFDKMNNNLKEILQDERK